MASVGVGLWVVGNHFLTTDIPAAISHPVRLWVFNCIFQLLITWVSFVCPLLQRIISLGQEDPLEKEMATHFSALAWRIPGTKEPGVTQSRTRLMRLSSSSSRVQLFVILWTVACQDPLSMEFSRQEYWNGLRFPPPGGLSDPGMEPMPLHLLHCTWILYH